MHPPALLPIRPSPQYEYGKDGWPLWPVASASSCNAASRLQMGDKEHRVHLKYLELTVSFVTDRAPASNCMPTTPRPTRWPPLIKLSKDRTMFRAPFIGTQISINIRTRFLCMSFNKCYDSYKSRPKV